jgi:hypothetical protein
MFSFGLWGATDANTSVGYHDDRAGDFVQFDA